MTYETTYGELSIAERQGKIANIVNAAIWEHEARSLAAEKHGESHVVDFCSNHFECRAARRYASNRSRDTDFVTQ